MSYTLSSPSSVVTDDRRSSSGRYGLIGRRGLRGGRMTKVNGRAASYADEAGGASYASASPSLLSGVAASLIGSVSSAALAATFRRLVAVPAMGTIAAAAIAVPALVGTSGDAAAACVETGAGTSVFNCTTNETLTQDLDGAVGNLLDVNVSPTVTFDTTGGAGDAFNLYSYAGIDFTQAAGGGIIAGYEDGIDAYNSGAGPISITTTGDVTGMTGRGIYATNSTAAGADITLNVGSVSGYEDGIYLRNDGGDGITITANGDVTGATARGISAINANFVGPGGITINAMSVTGNDMGIYARDTGSTGGISITVTGHVSVPLRDNSFSYGIRARQVNAAASGDTVVNATSVTSDGGGIYARQGGLGAILITATGHIQASRGRGIYLSGSSTNFAEMIANVASVTSEFAEGVTMSANGPGVLSLTASGAIIGLGTGINVRQRAPGGDVILDVASVAGNNRAIRARSDATADILITASGDLIGRNGVGIYTDHRGVGDIFITTSGLVEGRSGTAMDLNANSGDARVELQPGWDTIGETNAAGVSGNSRLVFGGDAGLNGGLSSFELADWDDGNGAFNSAGNEFFAFDPVLRKEDSSAFLITDDGVVAGTDGDGLAGPAFTEALVAGGALVLDDATLTMDGAATPFTIALGATLGGIGTSQITGNVNNFGSIDLSTFDMNAGTVLTITGNYTAGSSLFLDTTLEGDDSPTDLLVVDGNTAGITNVTFNVVGGAGAQTDTGIRVVDVNGMSNGTFVMANPDAVVGGVGVLVAGAYSYELTRGDDVGDDSSSDWFLKSTTFAPSVPIYETLPAALASLNGLPTLQQRVGNRYWNAADIGSTSSGVSSNGAVIEQNAIWTRVEGAHASVDPDTSTTDASYDTTTWQLRSGLDAAVVENEAGRLIGGINAAVGKSNLDVTSAFGNGDIDTTGYTLGGTLTWYGFDGLYVDGQAHYSWFDSDLTSDLLGRLADSVDGTGTAVSLEVGKRFALSETETIIPQAQLVYSSVDFDGFTDPFGAMVSMVDGDSLEGRMGLAAEHASSWYEDDGTLSRVAVYGIANVNYEFLDGSSVNVSGTLLDAQADAWTGDIGIGGSYNWSDDIYSLYAEASYGTSLSNIGDSYTLKGDVGFRMKW